MDSLDAIQNLVFQRVLRQIRNWTVVVFTLLSVFGVINILGMKQAIVDLSSSRLTSDDGVKEKIATKVADGVFVTEKQLGDLKKALEDAKTSSGEISQRRKSLPAIDEEITKVRADIQKQAQVASSSIETPLEEIDRMLRQLRDDIEQLRKARKAE